MRARALAGLFAAATLLIIAAPAHAGVTWCGGATDRDQADTVTSYEWHVIYAVPADAPDRFAEVVSPIASDIELIDKWWRLQDPARTPRFDLFGSSSCQGFAALDIGSVRLPRPASAYGADPETALIEVSRDLASLADPNKKYLVYYDGFVAGPACGISPIAATQGGVFSLVLLGTPGDQGGCGGLGYGDWRAVTAAHEMIHSMGALPPGAPHPCLDDNGHPCDSISDILYPGGGCCGLFDLALDAGRDDYYGHNGSWWDVQDSKWLRHLDAAPSSLEVKVMGAPGATVVSDVPGVNCGSDCTSAWEAGTQVTLTANPPGGYGFRSWTGCPSATTFECTFTTGGNAVVTAIFGPEQSAVSLRTVGKGTIRMRPGSLACTKRCATEVDRGVRVTLTAQPARDFRFGGWGGSCHGRRTTCALTVQADVDAAAVFKRR